MVDDALAAVVVAAMLAVISYAGFVLAAAQARGTLESKHLDAALMPTDLHRLLLTQLVTPGWLNASAVMAAYVAVQSLMIGISIDFAYFGHPSPPVAAGMESANWRLHQARGL